MDTVHDLRTPALIVDRAVFDANCAAMDAVRPGAALRPHVKAFKSTGLAAVLAEAGHSAFCAATPREIEGLVAAGLGHDLLLANESLDLGRLGPLVDDANITVAIDSEATLSAAVEAGLRSVLIDVNVGMPRCGCAPDDAPRLAERARAEGLEVRGVMGYEGHLMMVEDRRARIDRVDEAMAVLLEAADRVGGDVVSGGGTGTFDTNTACTEIQAGSYTLMDADYARLDLPFRPALRVLTTVVSVTAGQWIVGDAGIKALGMDHGDPHWDDGTVFFCSDEHITLVPDDGRSFSVGDRTTLVPGHVDPTVAKHEVLWVVDGEHVVDRWEVDLRHW
ncbi:MAG: alanine racemase [Actinomycetota bacterium]